MLYTARHTQLVVMALKPQEEIGAEVHTADQFRGIAAFHRDHRRALVVLHARRLAGGRRQDYLFFYVQGEQARDGTREWASWVVPLLLVELWISWLTQVRRGASPKARSSPA